MPLAIMVARPSVSKSRWPIRKGFHVAPLTYSRFANTVRAMIKGQDIVVLASLMDEAAGVIHVIRYFHELQDYWSKL